MLDKFGQDGVTRDAKKVTTAAPRASTAPAALSRHVRHPEEGCGVREDGVCANVSDAGINQATGFDTDGRKVGHGGCITSGGGRVGAGVAGRVLIQGESVAGSLRQGQVRISSENIFRVGHAMS